MLRCAPPARGNAQSKLDSVRRTDAGIPATGFRGTANIGATRAGSAGRIIADLLANMLQELVEQTLRTVKPATIMFL